MCKLVSSVDNNNCGPSFCHQKIHLPKQSINLSYLFQVWPPHLEMTIHGDSPMHKNVQGKRTSGIRTTISGIGTTVSGIGTTVSGIGTTVS